MYKVVASFFDGFSGTMFALDKLGIEPDEYHAFEIDPYPTAVSRYNFPNIIRHGDARNWTKLKGKKIDLLVAGFPCQSYSIAGLQKFQDDPRDMSKVLIQALKELDVDKVLIENVASMPTQWRDYFTQTFKEIFPDISLYLENSAKSSPQSRKRFYWTNIIYNDIKDEGMVLNDILEDGGMADRDKSHCLDANYFKGGNLSHYYNKARRQIVFDKNGCKQVGIADLNGHDILKRVYSVEGKSPTLNTCGGGNREPKIICGDKPLRSASVKGRRINEEGVRKDNDKSIPLIQTLEVYDNDKSRCLSTVDKDAVVSPMPVGRYPNAYEDNTLQWRKLTVKECCRLQTLPDDYCKSVSNSQGYKILGNGWTNEVIKFILKGENK